MAGCDGRAKSRSYYTEFAQALPKDTVILTAGCAKYKYNKLPLGDIGGIPRVLDAGQCNDSYSLALIALKLKEVFGLEDINDLPKIVHTYADRLLIEVKPDPKVVYDDEMTDTQLIKHIHRLVDTYGAQANPGSGAVMNLGCGSAHGFYLMEEELYQYSKKQYSGL